MGQTGGPKVRDQVRRETGIVTEVAQEVQRSAYPDAYADHESQGLALAQVFSGAATQAVGCRLDAPSSRASADQVVAKLRRQSGWAATAADPRTVLATAGSTQRAWAIGQWAVAQAVSTGATRVTVGDREWVRQAGADGWDWHPASTPQTATTVRIELG